MNGLKELNRKYAELYGEVYENKELYTDKHYKYVTGKLFEKYKAEFDLLEICDKTEYKMKMFQAKSDYAYYAPWKFLVFANPIGRLKQKEFSVSFDKYYFDSKHNVLLEELSELSSRAERLAEFKRIKAEQRNLLKHIKKVLKAKISPVSANSEVNNADR